MKVFIQIVDTITGNCQHALIDEPIKEGFEISNAVSHLVGHVKVDWNPEYKYRNLRNKPCTKSGIISETNKIINVIYYSDKIPFKE